MCRNCDKREDAASASREDEPCPEGEHDFGESGEWETDSVPNTEVICQNCGWDLGMILEHEESANVTADEAERSGVLDAGAGAG